jgi:hypothetical protein
MNLNISEYEFKNSFESESKYDIISDYNKIIFENPYNNNNDLELLVHPFAYYKYYKKTSLEPIIAIPSNESKIFNLNIFIQDLNGNLRNRDYGEGYGLAINEFITKQAYIHDNSFSPPNMFGFGIDNISRESKFILYIKLTDSRNWSCFGIIINPYKNDPNYGDLTETNSYNSYNWNCSSCTFKNENSDDVCKICENPKSVPHPPIKNQKQPHPPTYPKQPNPQTQNTKLLRLKPIHNPPSIDPKPLPDQNQSTQNTKLLPRPPVKIQRQPNPQTQNTKLLRLKPIQNLPSKTNIYWTCKKCTFDNKLNDKRCEMCDNITGGANYTDIFKLAIFVILLILLASLLYNILFNHEHTDYRQLSSKKQCWVTTTIL